MKVIWDSAIVFCVFLCLIVFHSEALAVQVENQLPSIVIILADDLGYGDLSCYNKASKVQTPSIDDLASEGIRFTDAHSAATVCTPSRYSLLTGRYAFRTPNHGRVFDGIWGPCLIKPERETLPTLLKKKGYATACIGKWHLGMTFLDREGSPINRGGREAVSEIDYSRKIENSPIDRGFDHFFGTVACPTTDWLYAFVDGNKVPVPATKQLDKNGLPKHPYANDNRPGMIALGFDLETVDLVFLEKSKTFINRTLTDERRTPFFLFHSMQAVHLPSFPADQFKGKTEAGPHGDFIHETDWIVGELLKTIEEAGISDNTIVIFTSDNGPETTAVHHMRADHGHDGAKPWRGMKRDNWEAGHRVPFIIKWPQKVAKGRVSDKLICHTDLIATVADLVGATLPDDAGEDRFSAMNEMLDWSNQEEVRPHIVHQGFAGDRKLAIRKGEWKFLNHIGSGGNNYRTDKILKQYALAEADPTSPAQLYNLHDDPGETTNLYSKYPSIAAEMSRLLNQVKQSGRSR